MVNSTNPNDKLLVPDPYQAGKKIRVSKFLLQISIFELQNDVLSESIIYKLKEEIGKIT